MKSASVATPRSRARGRAQELNVTVPDWGMVKRVRHSGPAPRRSARPDPLDRPDAGKPKVSKAKGHTSGRTYTSKYRGVHQTFPTKRWEAQFRRAPAGPCRACAVACLSARAGSSAGPLMRLLGMHRPCWACTVACLCASAGSPAREVMRGPGVSLTAC